MLRKIRDLEPYDEHAAPCSHPEHGFPTNVYLTSGVWEQECPRCGKKTRVIIPTRVCATGLR